MKVSVEKEYYLAVYILFLLKNTVAITPAGRNHYNSTRKLMWLLKLYLTFCGLKKEKNIIEKSVELRTLKKRNRMWP